MLFHLKTMCFCLNYLFSFFIYFRVSKKLNMFSIRTSAHVYENFYFNKFDVSNLVYQKVCRGAQNNKRKSFKKILIMRQWLSLTITWWLLLCFEFVLWLRKKMDTNGNILSTNLVHSFQKIFFKTITVNTGWQSTQIFIFYFISYQFS